MRPHYLDASGTAYVYLLSPGGGVVGGDRYAVMVTLEAGARACMTTASATKLYASPDSTACQHFEVILQAGTVFEYLPEQIIPFARSAYHQQMTVRLGSGALAVLTEIVAPGRLARGETFAYHDYSSGLCVADAHGRVLLRERTRLQPRRWDAGSALGLLEGFHYLGTLYVLSESCGAPGELADDLHGLVTDRRHCIGGATALERGGVVVRLLAEDHDTVSRALHAVWDRVRRRLLGYPAVRWRK
jgi:urease accessory protein